jgi:Mor family transcriptional regulator
MEYPEVLKDLADVVAELFQERGMEPEEAAKAGMDTADKIREYWGGQKIYIPKGVSFTLSKRDVEIYGRWKDRKATDLELCRQYDITHTRLYQIIHAVRRAQRPPDPKQQALFPKEENHP